MGWFYGFKLYLIVNYLGEIVAAKVTTGNVHDTQAVAELAKGLIDYSRHRSMKGFMLNLLAGLVAYCLKKYKPSLNLTDVERNSMVMVMA
jgi:hypothetical protein